MAYAGGHLSPASPIRKGEFPPGWETRQTGGAQLPWGKQPAVDRAPPPVAQETEVDPGSIVMEFDMPDTLPPSEEVARALKDAMGDSHESATLTCTTPESTKVYRWNADEERIQTIPFPEINVKASACYISDLAYVMVALVCGEKDEAALAREIDASTGAATMTTRPDQSAVEGEMQRMTLSETHNRREPDMSKPAVDFIVIKRKELRLRARMDGTPQMQPLRLRKCYDLSTDGGCVVAVFGEQVPWNPDYEPAPASHPRTTGLEGTIQAGPVAALPVTGTTQLQLTFDSIIIDRYELSADDVIAMREEIQDLRNDAWGDADPADESPPMSDQEDDMQD